MELSPILEGLLAVLLAATLSYCAILERRLRMLRKDQSGLVAVLGALNRSIAGAQAGVASLRTAANDAGEDLSRCIAPARALADELSLLTASGERIAERIAGSRPNERKAPGKPALAEGLRAVR